MWIGILGKKKTHQLREWLRHNGSLKRDRELVSELLRAGDALADWDFEGRIKCWERTKNICKLMFEPPLYKLIFEPPLTIPDKKRDDYGDKPAFGYYETACIECGTVLKGNWLREKILVVGVFTIIGFFFPLTWCCSIYWFLFSDWRAPENCSKCESEWWNWSEILLGWGLFGPD